MPTLDGRVLIFAGAGASKAVRNDMFPTTREFFDQLQPNITDQQLFQFAMEFLRLSHKEESIDIEHVLWALQTLLSYYDNIKNPKDIAGFALQNGLIERLFPGQHVGHLTQVAPQLCAKLEQLISDINQVVYDLYSYEPTPDELQENWIKIISEFEGFGTRLDIFTTNYDVAIEAALNYINGDVTARNWCGIKGTVRQTLDLTN